MINLEVDFGPVTEFLDINRAMAKVMQSGRTANKMTLAMGLSTSSAFNQHADQMALAMPGKLHHVYEWQNVGVPAARLWTNVMTGSGNSRQLNFLFNASKTRVPAGQAATGIAGDTRRMRHVFRWKAAIMESGQEVTVYGKNRDDDLLAFPGRGGRGGFKRGRMVYVRAPITTRPGRETAGMFTALWVQFFDVTAIELVNDEFRRPARNFFENTVPNKLYRKISRGKAVPKKNRISVNAKALVRRDGLATRETEEFVNAYVKRARARR